MAGFNLELPEDLINNLKTISNNTDEMFGQMTKAGAEVVYKNVVNNMKSSFKYQEHIKQKAMIE